MRSRVPRVTRVPVAAQVQGDPGDPREGTVPWVRRERRGRLAAEGWVLLVPPAPSVGGDRWVTLAHRTTVSDWHRGTQGEPGTGA
ncbi:hypothetical protein [Frog virus 3]|uniref:Uncharacterized protein n=1 Tax=Frog virus 3 TaxID=10493 RepID=A0A3G2Y361_FRG3V|nr:hypothetical protein [Frog virus 3]